MATEAEKTQTTKQVYRPIEVYCPKCSKLFHSTTEMIRHYEEEHELNTQYRKRNVPQTETEKKEYPPNNKPAEQTKTEPETREQGSKAIFTKNTTTYLLIAAGLLAIGILLENPIFLYSSFVPMFFVLTGAILQQPKKILLNRCEMKSNCYAGETIEIATDIDIEEGIGYLVIRDILPKHFEIVEGQDFKTIWKGRKPIHQTLSYKVRCTKRGVYIFDKIDYEFRHVLGLRQTIIGQYSQPKRLSVQLRNVPIRRIRNTKTLSKLPLPLGALNKTGISTTDFKEIRQYTPNDPYRSINWKITSRMSTSKATNPYVNEFEKEGKKFVWIFVDGSYSMGSYGTIIGNAFEHAIAAVNDLAQYYLERECFVGVYLYNKRHTMIYPDIGRRQRFKIQKELLLMEMNEPEPLRKAIQRCRPHLIGNSPLSIVITALSESNVDDLVEGIKELRKYNKSYVKSSVLLINVKSYAFAAKTETEKLSASILQCKDHKIQNRMRQTGTMLVDWNPATQPLTHVLVSEVKRR